jgi:NAD(P)H dehydrogenase (quinone)
MKVSVILAHPNKESLNRAIAKVVVDTLKKKKHKVYFHDLYEEEFDPLLPFEEIEEDAILPDSIMSHCEEISISDGIVIVHPNWWGQPPAILKGWIDRVLRVGLAYQFLDGDSKEGVPVGMLKASIAIVFNTSNAPPELERQVFGDPLETLWKECVFGFCGVKDFYRKNFGVIVTSTDKERKKWLEEVRSIIKEYF